MDGCPLCQADLAPSLKESTHWSAVLNRNQNLLGKTMLVLRRHIEEVSRLSEAEWLELHKELAQVTRALEVAFSPEHFNYAFLQNQDRHVHLHVIPRYAGARTFGGLTFADPDFPDHYRAPAPQRRLAPADLAAIAERVRQALSEEANGSRV